MKFNLKLRLLSGVLCAAVLWTPLTASAAETGGSSPSKDSISGRRTAPGALWRKTFWKRRRTSAAQSTTVIL